MYLLETIDGKSVPTYYAPYIRIGIRACMTEGWLIKQVVVANPIKDLNFLKNLLF